MAILACSLPLGASPTVVPEIPPVTLPPTDEPTTTPSPVPVAGPGTFNISVSTDLAAGFIINEIPQVLDDGGSAPWGVAPTHWEVTLPNYPLQGKFHEPKIYIYPAPELMAVNEGAARNIKSLQEALAADPLSPIDPAILPGVHFFNAGSVFKSNIQNSRPFQGGDGVRWLTLFAQYFAPVNNRELIYIYQGLTSDGKFYVIAILPITHPSLAEDEKMDAPIPAGGIPFPTDPAADMTGYYNLITDMLDITQPGAFSPSLETLDFLVQSIKITP
ncbi:MAG: hypothetical protein CVU44_08785 [Chloroflexi bacterium HGW-Chloroflexi-6]|nr:MAG: hypothetical protein CVU44_08785 [Chloroflexi bacterium HGW-Chloroflexi-6]